MYTSLWNYKELFGETIPRSVYFTYVQLYLLTKKLPTDLVNEAGRTRIEINLIELYTQTYKNYNDSFDKISFLLNRNDDLVQPETTNYGVASKIISKEHNPGWAKLVTNTDWYWKHLKAYKISKNTLSLIPGIKQIYITASPTMAVSKKNSDIDLLVKVKRGWSWPVRIILKLLLKILNLDVHSFKGELGISLSKILYKIGMVEFSNKIKKSSEEKIFKYKNRSGTKIDIGLIYTNKEVLNKIFKKETRHLLFSTSLLISDQDIESDFDFGNLSYDPFQAGWVRWVLNFPIKLVILLMLILILPFSIIIFAMYYNKHRNNPNFLVNFNTICFYPLIFKEGFFKSIK